MARLQNKIALITGAAQGIGKAIAQAFHAEGATVIVTDIQNDKGLGVSEQLTGSHFKLLDVTQETQWQQVTDWVLNTFGGLDILVNNAGIAGFFETSGPHNPEDFDLDSWRKVHAVNLDGTALGCKYAIKMMKHRHSPKQPRGSIVNISSRSGIVGIPQMPAYAASKAAVRNHTKSVALYCAESGYKIRCNSIHPGAILTEMWDAMLGEGEQRQHAIASVAKGVPLGSMGEPNDVAFAALYLASEESQYITGTELHVDGGILAGATAQPTS